MDVYVVLLHDKESGCFGVSQPMNEKETDKFIVNAREYGYDLCSVSLNDLFNDGHQDLDVYWCK